MIKLTETPEEIYYCAAYMRAQDRDEIQAVSGVDIDPHHLTEYILNAPGTAWTSWAADVPVAVFGFVPMWPGVANLWAFGTDEWGCGLLAMTRWLRTGIIREMHANNLHRVECKAKASRKDIYRWLTRLGARVEGHHVMYGRDQSDYICYAWTLKDEQRKQAN